MNFDLKRPCANCPFRVEGAIELRPGRIEQIAGDLLADDCSWFICHKTIAGEHQQDERGEQHYEAGGTESQCVGSMVYLLKVGAPSVSMRIAAALGLLDYEALRAQAHHIIDPL